MRTVIGNRIGFLESGLFVPPQVEYEIIDKKSQIKAYKDCLNILKQEFFELQLPYLEKGNNHSTYFMHYCKFKCYDLCIIDQAQKRYMKLVKAIVTNIWWINIK